MNIFVIRKISFTASRSNLSNVSGLDEYVDILQVQQLLLDSSPSTSTTTTGSTVRPRPKVNLQKAAEYSAQSQGMNNSFILLL